MRGQIDETIPEDCFPRVYQGDFFRREAPKKERAARLARNEWHRADLRPGGVVGKNYFNTIMKRVATRAGLDNPERVTARAMRSTGITQLAEGQGERMNHSRHLSVKTHPGYQRLDMKTKQLRWAAQHHRPARSDCIAVVPIFSLTLLFFRSPTKNHL